MGLSNVSGLYRTAIKNGNNEAILAQSIAANTQFAAMVPGFQLGGEEVKLLPLFAIAATLHLALLRDMVLKGTEIGLSAAHVGKLAEDMGVLINQYSRYVDTYVAAAIEQARVDNPNASIWQKRNMPLSAMLEKKAQLQITVIDFRDTWSGFDPIRFPGKSPIKLDREVYTPIIGWWDSKTTTPEAIPVWEPPQSSLTGLKVWDRAQWTTRFIYGFESSYADGSKLSSGVEKDTVHNISFKSTIDEVVTHTSTGVFHMSFHSDGKWLNVGTPSSNHLERKFRNAIAGHRLSSIRALGTGTGAAEGGVSGCVLGFQLIDQDATTISLEAFDVIAPKIAPQLVEWIAY